MKKIIISDFSRTILFPKNDEIKKLNKYHRENKDKKWYDINKEFYINTDLLDVYKSFNWKKYIFTTWKIQEEKEIKDKIDWIFDDIFIVDNFWEKTDKETYLKLADKLWYETKNILFIDDSENNIIAAKEVWLQTFLYSQNKNEELKNILKIN